MRVGTSAVKKVGSGNQFLSGKIVLIAAGKSGALRSVVIVNATRWIEGTSSMNREGVVSLSMPTNLRVEIGSPYAVYLSSHRYGSLLNRISI